MVGFRGAGSWPRCAGRWLVGAASALAVAATVACSPAWAQAAPAPPPAGQQPHSPAAVTVRLFIDLECPHSRKAWPRYRTALAGSAGSRLIVHHLPQAIHPLARSAAQAALAARLQGKELAFVDAVMAQPGADDASIARAAQLAGVDVAAMARDLNSPRVLQAVERERQAALAFGVRATPSALVNGKGLGGVPSEQALGRTLADARRQAEVVAQQAGPGADPERLGLLRQQPEFVAAFDVLRAESGSPEGVVTQPRGVVGTLYRVDASAGDLSLGATESPVTLVLFLDPEVAWPMAEAQALRRVQVADRRVRLVFKVLTGAQTREVDLWLAALADLADRESLLVRLIDAGGPWTLQAVQKAARVQGAQAQLEAGARQPRATGWLHGQAELARRVDARPGSLYINGKLWLGRAADAGLQEAIAAAAHDFAQKVGEGVPAGRAYQALTAQGRFKTEEEMDLRDGEALGDLSALPTLGGRGTDVVLLLDFGSLASRAAWQMLRRLPASGRTPIRLHIGVLQNGVAAPLPWYRALLAGQALRVLPEAVDALFSLQKRGTVDQPGLCSQLKKAKTECAAAWAAADPDSARRGVAAARERTDWGDEPVIFVDGRLYVGPLDEERLLRAASYVRHGQAPSAPGAAQEAAR